MPASQDVKTKLAAPRQRRRPPDYTDYKIGITKTFSGGWTVGLAYSKASNSAYYDYNASATTAGQSHDLGRAVTVLSVSRVF